jgi:hypothetical protein
MFRRQCAQAACGLLMVVGIACVERSRAPAHAGADGRQVTWVPREARDAVRTEMRTMLGSLHEILNGSLVGDTSAMQAAAKRSGLGTAVDPTLEKLLPEGFLRLGVSTHQQFDDLAAALATGIPPDSVASRLTRITGNCVSCHASYTLELR